jgi:hypothetical protein
LRSVELAVFVVLVGSAMFQDASDMSMKHIGERWEITIDPLTCRRPIRAERKDDLLLL